jgi:hypothetical protein
MAQNPLSSKMGTFVVAIATSYCNEERREVYEAEGPAIRTTSTVPAKGAELRAEFQFDETPDFRLRK